VSKLQWEIIKTAWDYVKPGGILMYSTCTVNRDENEAMVSRICSELPFEPVNIKDMLPQAFTGGELAKTAENGYIQLLPGQYGTDGFFISKLRRKEK
jgi:16S rRNA (cytosine967-C5)-methyltransferase